MVYDFGFSNMIWGVLDINSWLWFFHVLIMYLYALMVVLDNWLHGNNSLAMDFDFGNTIPPMCLIKFL